MPQYTDFQQVLNQGFVRGIFFFGWGLKGFLVFCCDDGSCFHIFGMSLNHQPFWNDPILDGGHNPGKATSTRTTGQLPEPCPKSLLWLMAKVGI